MFEKLTQNDLLKLTSVQEGPCISIYIPKMPEKTLQLEFDALVRRASHLLAFDERETLRNNLLSTVAKFKPTEYLTEKDKGLALFVNKHWSSYFLAAHELPSKTVVADTFHLKPLLEDVQGSNVFQLLVITPVEAVLFHSDAGQLNEVHNFLVHQGQHSNSFHWKQGDQSETTQLPHIQNHTRGRGVKDNKFKNRANKLFLKWIDAKISADEKFKKLPLYVFSGEALLSAFKEITVHPNPVLCKIEINGGIPRIENLIHQANLQLQKQINTQKKSSLGAVRDSFKKKRVVDDLFKISKAAISGKIKTLYLRDNIEIWGQLRRKSGEILVHEKQLNSKDDDLLDDIACEVIRHGGEVIVLASKEMPTPSPAAAILSP